MIKEFQIEDDLLLQYFHKASMLVDGFEKVDIEHIPREENARAKKLSNLESRR